MIKRLMYFTFLICLWLGGISVKAVITSTFITLIITYIIVPIIYHFSSSIQRHLVFLTFVNYPKNVDFTKPENLGLPGTRNFYLETDKHLGVKVGIWHILPNCLIDDAPNKESEDYESWYNNSLSDDRPVLLYLHGNTASRAIAHRIELYNLLRKLDWHVVAFDYRGYADSTRVTMNELGVVHDAKEVYNFINNLRGNSNLIVWGHSLGTGVSCHAVGSVCQEGNSPSALILESPFNNLKDEIKYHPLTSIFRNMPNFEWLFLDPLTTSGIEFNSDEHIAHINVPVLILHAADDLVVPFMLGKRLYTTAMRVRKDLPPMKFLEFESGCGYGHKYICRAPLLPKILTDFLAEVSERSKKLS